MKCTKGGVLTALGLLTLTGLTAALFVSAADSMVNISDNITNAVQHIGTVKFVNNNNTANATLSQQGAGQVGIDTNNFLIIKSGDSITKIKVSAASSILGGMKNIVNGSNNAVIVAGSGNQVLGANNSTIVGGFKNKNSSSNSTIIGGFNNIISQQSDSSAIIGGDSNEIIRGINSAILGKNNKVRGNYSVALGENSKLSNANNSFLWTDGSYSDKELSYDDVFAVVSEGGMVVNTDTRNPLAKLTISGSLVVGENTTKNSNIACEGGTNGKGILKLVSKGDGTTQSCLCSCDGYTWNSLYGDGKCASVCNNDMLPRCGSSLSKIYLTETEFIYSGSCEEGVVIPKSYYVEGETIYWYCQTSDGAVSDKCSTDSSGVEVIETICYPSTSSCGKGYKTGGAAWNPGYTCELNGDKQSCSCPEGKVWNGDACVYANKGGVCNNGVSDPSKDGCNIGAWSKGKNISSGSVWNCVGKDENGRSINYNSSICYSCNDGSIWDESTETCKSQSDICNGGAGSCKRPYELLGGATWGYNYYCNKEGSSIECTCSSGKIWNGSSCVVISTPTPCNTGAVNPSTAGCYYGNYANVSEENGYVWNCKAANGDNLNGDNLCHKCDSDSTWNGERCVKKGDICGAANCGDDYELSGGVVWGYNYYCNKEGSESLTCSCDGDKIWNGSACVSIGETPCNTGAADVTSNGCNVGVYSGVQITNGYKWDCLNSTGGVLNSEGICYKCDNGFAWNSDSGQCVEIPDGKCTLSDTQHTVLADGDTIEMYYDSEVYCPEICQKHVVTECNNGVISGSTNPRAEYEENCDTYGILCTEATLDTCPEYGKCNSCTGYTFSDNVCIKGDTKQYLVSCTGGYKKYGTGCFSSRDYPCLSGGGTWTITKNAEEAGYVFGNGYYAADWRILDEGIVPYYKTGTCGSTISCSSKGYSCGGSFVPKQQYRRSYTIYAEHYADYHQCSNNSSLNYYTVSEDEDGNEVYVVEDDDYTDETHLHGECGANASEVCWDESDGLYYQTDNNGIAWYSTGSNGLRLLCENYGWDCSTGAQHPINCDTCFFEVENLGKVSDGSTYGNPGTCSDMLPSSYMESNGVVDCGYRGRDIYCWSGSYLMHYSGVWGTESPRVASGAHTSIDTRYCGGAHGHKVSEAPSSYLCMKGTSSSITHYGGNYQWSCSYGSRNVSCWACEGGTEEECWSSPTNSCRAQGGCPETLNGGTCTSYYSDSPAGACTSITSTCNNGTWDKTPYDYSSCTQGCASVKGCSAAKNGASCTTYSTNISDSCSSYSRTSVCNAGTWSQTPLQYSSCGGCTEEIEFNPSWAQCGNAPNEGSAYDRQCESDASSRYGGGGWSCGYSYYCPGHEPMCECSRTVECKNCSASGACPATSHEGECTTYSSASPTGACTSITSKCNNGVWSQTPYNYSSCTAGCSASGGCPASTNGSTCTTYSTGSSNACSSYRRTSTCNAGTWSPVPYSYSSCTKSRDTLSSVCDESCFLSGTHVITQDGIKNIEDLQEGEMVLSYNVDSEEQVYKKVKATLHREVMDEELYEIAVEDDILKVTGTHAFYVVDKNDGYQCSRLWKRARELEVGDMLLKEDGSHVTIDGINHYLYSGMVYNFEVEDTHGYYVGNGYLVHNIDVLTEEACAKKL